MYILETQKKLFTTQTYWKDMNKCLYTLHLYHAIWLPLNHSIRRLLKQMVSFHLASKSEINMNIFYLAGNNY